MYQDPIDEESYEFDENTYNELNYFHSTNSSNDLIDDFEDDLDDENFTIKYINEYSVKMDEDITEMHSRQKDLRKEAIERYKQLQQEWIKLSEWKQRGMVQLRNYKIALKEIIRELEEKCKENDDLKIAKEDEIEKIKRDKLNIMKDWKEDKENWKKMCEEECNRIKEEIEHEYHLKIEEFQHKIIDCEGQIEDSNRELASVKSEKLALQRKFKAEIARINQFDLQVSVRSCVENMLNILELKEINKQNKSKIKLLEDENKELKKRSLTSKRKITIKNNQIPKLNISDISLSKNPSINKFRSINKSAITVSGKQKIKLSKNKIKNLNNYSNIETNEESILDSKLKMLKSELDMLTSEKTEIK